MEDFENTKIKKIAQKKKKRMPTNKHKLKK
jgi:hypothetical protein